MPFTPTSHTANTPSLPDIWTTTAQQPYDGYESPADIWLTTAQQYHGYDSPALPDAETESDGYDSPAATTPDVWALPAPSAPPDAETSDIWET